jgi:hypothetical protein
VWYPAPPARRVRVPRLPNHAVQPTPLARPQPGRDLHATSVRMPVPFATAASGAADGCLFGSRRKGHARTVRTVTAAACRHGAHTRMVRAPRAGACGIRRPQPVRSAGPGSRTTPCSRRRWRVPDLGAISTARSCRCSARSRRLPAAQLTAVCWAAGGRVVPEPSGPCTAAACRHLSRARMVRAPRASACGIRRPQPVRYASPGSRTTPCSRRRWRVPDLGAICTPCSCRRSSRSTRLPAAQLTAVC